MNNKLKKLIQKEIKYLSDIKINVKNPKIINVDLETKNKDLFNDLIDIKGQVIYIITINLTFSLSDLNKIEQDFEELKNKHKFAMCRINKKNWECIQNCLYIGSSKEIIKRLKEHIGINEARTTYALHLNKWLKSGNLNIEIYQFDNTETNVQLFEDLLWKDYKPLFGRQGKK